MIPLSGRVPGRASEPSRARVDDGGGSGTFRGWKLGCLGFFRERQFIGEGAMSVEARGLLTTWRRGRGARRAGLWCGPPACRRPFAYLFPRCENPKHPIHYPRKVPETPPPSTLAREGPEPLPGTLPERGIITGGLYITMPASGVMRE